MRLNDAPVGRLEPALMPVTMEDVGGPRQASGPATSLLTHWRYDMGVTTTDRARSRWAVSRAEIGGRVLRMTAKAQKAIALAAGWTGGWVSRLKDGHPAAGRYLELVERLAGSRATDAAPLAAAPLASLCRVMAERESDDGLDAAIQEAIELGDLRRAQVRESELALLFERSKAEPDQVPELEDRLLFALLGSMAAQATMAGILMERARRRVVRVH